MEKLTAYDLELHLYDLDARLPSYALVSFHSFSIAIPVAAARNFSIR
jgi:hypothetical protein